MTDAQTLERRRWLGLGLLASAQFVVVLDASIVNVALPSIGRALDFSQSNLAWVVNSYVSPSGASCSWEAASPTCSAAAGCSWVG